MFGSGLLSKSTYFNPRIPCGMRREEHSLIGSQCDRISIHASHAGCDLRIACPIKSQAYFNPRIPCGMRPLQGISGPCHLDFNPRIPCGMRRKTMTRQSPPCHFNPRIPCGMRRECALDRLSGRRFQSTHPMRDATYYDVENLGMKGISIHASHAGCDEEVL